MVRVLEVIYKGEVYMSHDNVVMRYKVVYRQLQLMLSTLPCLSSFFPLLNHSLTVLATMICLRSTVQGIDLCPR
jgi:hypothetical protein